MNEVPPSQGLIGGKYQLVRMIGKGGMGSVWEARHASLGTPSAIKFIEAEYANSTEARSRFDKEAKAAATIQSKHAIQIYDHGVTDDGKPYIVMELLQGEPLDKYIDRQRLALPEVARILQQVCRGLSRAHERGIIHRDLKPENIFLCRSPEDDEVVAKVLDFGIAKISNGGPNSGSGGITSGTKTGAVLGTPFYMSPEQARGLRNVDHRTDVWSLGVIAFKCLTGKLPFDGESIGDLLVKICTSPIPVPSQLYPGIPPAFDGWFARALEREPERRFGTVTELADALCMIAGVATRSQANTPAYFGSIPSSGAPRNSGSTPPGLTAPMSSAAGPPITPAPYGMAYPPASPMSGATNAPFTKESIPGVAPGRGKLVATVMVVSLAIGCLGAVVLLKSGGDKHGPVATGNGAAITGTIAPVEKASTPTADPSVTAPVMAKPLATKPAETTKTAEPKTAEPKTPKAKPGVIPTSPPPLPSPTATHEPAPVVTAPPKKPNRDDPGY